MTTFVAVMLPLVLSLGSWQVERGAEKRGLEMDYLERVTMLPVRPNPATESLQRFQRVRLQGNFATEVFLVDNQVSGGKTGYWIVQCFDDSASGRRYLVNRGYIQAPPVRSEMPVLSAPEGPLEVVGAIWPFTGLIPVLDDDAWPEGWPKRVQRLDVARMAAQVGAEPFEVRLEPGQPGVQVAAPFAQVLSDAKHRGYAATWFGLAIALVAGYLVFGFKNGMQQTNEETEQTGLRG